MIKIISGPNVIQFHLVKRENVHTKKGTEWDLTANLGGDWWTYKTYEKKPTKQALKEDKELILRTMEVYHSHLFVPNFRMVENEYPES